MRTLKIFITVSFLVLSGFLLSSCAKEEYTVNFDSNGGTIVSPITFTEGSTILMPTDPTKEGYTFGGWYVEEDLTDTYSFKSTPTSDFTLYAKWTVNRYTITFDSMGGSVVSAITEDFAAVVTAPVVPTKDGYMFDGWYTNVELTTSFTFTTMPAIDTTLYAKWSNSNVDPVTYTIIWQNDDASILETDTVEAGVLPTYDGSIPTKASTDTYDYTFIGFTPTVVVASENQTYTATYEATMIDSTTAYDPTELNSIFGYDIYSTMPSFTTDDVLLYDYTDDTFFEVYIDIFDWTDADAQSYMDLLDDLLVYDDTEESWIIGDYYLYVYVDDETYPGEIVNGIGIYGERESGNATEDPRADFDPAELNTIFGFDIYRLMPSFKTDDSELFDYTEGTFFEVYIDVFDWTNDDALMYMDLLDDLLVYDDIEESWIIGDYYLYIYADDETYPGEIVNGIGIYGEQKSNTALIESWDDAVLFLEDRLEETTLHELLPDFDGLTDISVINESLNHFVVMAGLNTQNNAQAVAAYHTALTSNGFVSNSELSTTYGEDVYSLMISDYLAYSVFIRYGNSSMEMHLWKYDPVIEIASFETIEDIQSITEYEISAFAQSGLPSIGTYNVLVIPIEINGTPFPADYLSKLDLVFNGTSSSTGWESVASFYNTSSFGLLDITFDIDDKFTTSHDKSYYENFGDEGDQYAILEALLALDSSIDFSQYDVNNDGLIDSIIFVYSVDYDYDINPWWAWVYSAQYGEASTITTLDGKGFEYYAWVGYTYLEDELPGVSGLVVNAETYIHEMGHLMGFPDLYSMDHDYGPIGGFDMMDYNSGDHGPFNKLMFGWLQPLLAVEGSYEVTIDSYATDTDGISSAILVPYDQSDLDDGDAFDEYLLIIFYTPEGLYTGHLNSGFVPEDAGIVIYHIDASLYEYAEFWDTYFNYNNDGTSLFIAEILEADFNNSLPSNYMSISASDLLTNGLIDLSSYSWHQGGSIDVTIELTSVITNTSDSATIILTVY